MLNSKIKNKIQSIGSLSTTSEPKVVDKPVRKEIICTGRDIIKEIKEGVEDGVPLIMSTNFALPMSEPYHTIWMTSATKIPNNYVFALVEVLLQGYNCVAILSNRSEMKLVDKHGLYDIRTIAYDLTNKRWIKIRFGYQIKELGKDKDWYMVTQSQYLGDYKL